MKARLHWVDAVQANVFVSVHMVDLNNGYVVGYRSPATGIGLFKLVGRALAQLGAIITLATSTATVRTVRININAATIVITVSINHTVVLTDTDTYGTGNGLL